MTVYWDFIAIFAHITLMMMDLKKILTRLCAAAVALTASAAGDTAAYPAFAFGADTSWYTQMEAEGVNPVYDSDGNPATVPQLAADYGFDAVRLRLWVDPANDMAQTGGFCGLDDVLLKARAATSLGQRVMIDFQYSDTWADAGNQRIPAAWSGLTSPAQLADKVYTYTRSVMAALKDAGVNVAWVQLGNETSNGMLFDYGRFAIDNVTAPSRVDNFISFFNAGAKAAREIYPSVKTVCHLNNGYDFDMYNWFFGEIYKRPVTMDFDYIGMSLYPVPCDKWDSGNPDFCKTAAWRARTDQALNAIPRLHASFGKRFLICETGFPNLWTLSAPGGASASPAQMEAKCNTDVADFLTYFVDGLKRSGLCDGIFYWEPECNYFHDYSMGALTSLNRPNAAWEYVRNSSSFAGIGGAPLDTPASPAITVAGGVVTVNGEPVDDAAVYTPDGRRVKEAGNGIYVISIPGYKPVKTIIAQ